MTFDPDALNFYLNANWRCRPDDSRSVGRRFGRFIDALADVDPTLTSWEVGKRYSPYHKVRDNLSTFIERNVVIGEDRKPEREAGFKIRGLTTDRRQLFSFVGSAGSTYTRGYPPNYIYFFTNTAYRAADPEIVTYQLMKGVMLATIDCWEPAFCAAYSSALEPERSDGQYRKAWISYVPPQHAVGIDLVGIPFAERTRDGGLLLSATDRTFDAADPTHVEGAQVIHLALRHLEETPPAD